MCCGSANVSNCRKTAETLRYLACYDRDSSGICGAVYLLFDAGASVVCFAV